MYVLIFHSLGLPIRINVRSFRFLPEITIGIATSRLRICVGVLAVRIFLRDTIWHRRSTSVEKYTELLFSNNRQ